MMLPVSHHQVEHDCQHFEAVVLKEAPHCVPLERWSSREWRVWGFSMRPSKELSALIVPIATPLEASATSAQALSYRGSVQEVFAELGNLNYNLDYLLHFIESIRHNLFHYGML
jgi:hypothetical protein